METGRRRAMVACLDANAARRLTDMLTATGFDAACAVYRARDVLPALRAIRPGVLLAEAILPGGDGVSLAKAITGASLNRYPHVLLTAVPGLRLPGTDVLEAHGAAALV